MIRALALAFLCTAAQADAVLFDVYTKHPDSQPWMQNKTPGIQYVADNGLTVGGFCNSYSASDLKPEYDSAGRTQGRRNCANTWDAGWTWDSGGRAGAGLVALGALGYGRGIAVGHVHVMPVVMPYLRLGPVQLGVLAPATWHLSLRFHLGA